jgi:tetratricopeptide (TPR) repeat protein
MPASAFLLALALCTALFFLFAEGVGGAVYAPTAEEVLVSFRPDFAGAAAVLSRAQRDGLSHGRHVAAADLHLSKGRPSDAAQAYETLLRLVPLAEDEVAPVHLALGHVYAELSLFTRAEAAYAAGSVSGRWLRHAAHAALGHLHARRGMMQDAFRSFETSLYYRRDYFDAVHSLGSLHFIAGDVEQGIAHYSRALRLLEEAGLLEDSAQAQQADGGEGVRPGGGGGGGGMDLVAHVVELLTPGGITAPGTRPPTSSPSASAAAAAATAASASASPSSDAPPTAGAALVATGRSLRAFLRRLQTLDLAVFHRALGLKLQDMGAFEEGIRHLRRAIALAPDAHGYLLLYCTLALPLVFDSMEEVWAARGALARNVREALEDRVAVTHPERLHELYALTHQLPYTGLPAHLVMRDVARLVASSDAPVLDTVAPGLYRAFPFALAHATGNARWEGFSPHAYAAAAGGPAPPGRFVRPPVRDYFVLPAGTPRRDAPPRLLDGLVGGGGPAAARGDVAAAAAAAAAAAGTADLPRSPSAVVRVGLLTYQVHDCPAGNLFLALARHLRGYAAAKDKAAEDGAAAGGRAASASAAWEGSSRGGGTRPRVVRAKDTAEAGATGGDPLLRHGYVSVPGVAAFNVTLFRLRYGGDNVTRQMNDAVDHVQILPARPPFDLDAVRAAIAREKIDVLVASDPGILPEMYTLLFGRTAPVQVALWGAEGAHTLTLGLPDSVDYLVVGDGAAEPRIQDGMQEQVVRLGDTGVFFTPPAPLTDAERLAGVVRHGLLESRHLYLVPQTLNGLHPAFDAVLVGILAADPVAEVAFFCEDGQDLWRAKLQGRLQRADGMTAGMAERVRVLPSLPLWKAREKLALFEAADVVLDTFPVGIGVTALEVLDLGTPVVTLPSRQPLRRLVGGVLGRMRLAEALVAQSVEEMVRLAVALATDPAHRKRVKQAVLGRRAVFAWGPSSVPAAALTSGGAWRHLPSTFAGNASSSTASDSLGPAATREVLERLEEEGYGDAALGTLNDWLRFLGGVGRPWAEDREATELEEESGAESGGAARQARGGRRAAGGKKGGTPSQEAERGGPGGETGPRRGGGQKGGGARPPPRKTGNGISG